MSDILDKKIKYELSQLARYAEVHSEARKRIRLRLTLAIIEDILRS